MEVNSNANKENSIPFETVKSRVIRGRTTMMNCSDCGSEPENLSWFEFSSSGSSWAHLAGRQGYYSSCPKCELKVQEIITRRS